MGKRFCSYLLAAVLVFLLSATTVHADSGRPVKGRVLTSAVLVADFANGSVNPNEKTRVYNSKKAITPEELASALSRWTGLDFTVKITLKKDAILVDWAPGSTLISNLDDREQKKGFHFFDADSMRWFMMDSLWRTLKGAFDKEVYYTMNGGKQLEFDDLSPIKVFPADVPYMGSPFYFAHSDGRGDME
ncbi:MAG: hypothetical protein ACOX9B_11190 [Candidatus Xenobium sp.]|jgi:hypothetical protein|nr:hypothetical protein [Burkholderiales bacterium]